MFTRERRAPSRRRRAWPPDRHEQLACMRRPALPNSKHCKHESLWSSACPSLFNESHEEGGGTGARASRTKFWSVGASVSTGCSQPLITALTFIISATRNRPAQDQRYLGYPHLSGLCALRTVACLPGVAYRTADIPPTPRRARLARVKQTQPRVGGSRGGYLPSVGAVLLSVLAKESVVLSLVAPKRKSSGRNEPRLAAVCVSRTCASRSSLLVP